MQKTWKIHQKFRNFSSRSSCTQWSGIFARSDLACTQWSSIFQSVKVVSENNSKISYLMKHNKLCCANAGRTNRLPRLITHVEFAFVHDNGFNHVSKQTCLVPRQHAIHSLPKAGIIGLHSFSLENFSSTVLQPHWAITPSNLIYTKVMQIFEKAARQSTSKIQLPEEPAINGHFKYSYITFLLRLPKLGKIDLSRASPLLTNLHAWCVWG